MTCVLLYRRHGLPLLSIPQIIKHTHTQSLTSTQSMVAGLVEESLNMQHKHCTHTHSNFSRGCNYEARTSCCPGKHEGSTLSS